MFSSNSAREGKRKKENAYFPKCLTISFNNEIIKIYTVGLFSCNFCSHFSNIEKAHACNQAVFYFFFNRYRVGLFLPNIS